MVLVSVCAEVTPLTTTRLPAVPRKPKLSTLAVRPLGKFTLAGDTVLVKPE